MVRKRLDQKEDIALARVLNACARARNFRISKFKRQIWKASTRKASAQRRERENTTELCAWPPRARHAQRRLLVPMTLVSQQLSLSLCRGLGITLAQGFKGSLALTFARSCLDDDDDCSRLAILAIPPGDNL